MTYKVYLSSAPKPTSFKRGKGIIVLEPDNYTKEQIKAIKGKGYAVLGYLSAGTLEDYRSWWRKFSKHKLKRLSDWPHEWYMDLRKTDWRSFLLARAVALKGKGFDGWWLDNLDVYSEYKSKAMFDVIKAFLQKLQGYKGYVMINGGSEWVDDAIDKGLTLSKFLDGYTQEEVFSRITDYSGKGKFGKQTAKDSKYYKELIKKAEKRKVNCFLLEYTRDKVLREKIKEWCKKNKVDYYIAKDVNL